MLSDDAGRPTASDNLFEIYRGCTCMSGKRPCLILRHISGNPSALTTLSKFESYRGGACVIKSKTSQHLCTFLHIFAHPFPGLSVVGSHHYRVVVISTPRVGWGGLGRGKGARGRPGLWVRSLLSQRLEDSISHTLQRRVQNSKRAVVVAVGLAETAACFPNVFSLERNSGNMLGLRFVQKARSGRLKSAAGMAVSKPLQFRNHLRALIPQQYICFSAPSIRTRKMKA